MSSRESAGSEADLAIIGGSGLYSIDRIDHAHELEIATPFGQPSDRIRVGRFANKRVALLPRHGRSHGLLPGEINYRANIYALKSLGVRAILSVSAVGSMREKIRPRQAVLVDQFIDRTQNRASTFFGDGLVAHVSFAEPICPVVRSALREAAEHCGAEVHDGGTYVCIEGPAFSTRAESRLYRSWDVDVIGMTNLQEARLAREAEICYASLSMVTDYDCWHGDVEDVSVNGVLENLAVNARLSEQVVLRAASLLPLERSACECGHALRDALLTRLDRVPPETLQRLRPLIGKYLDPPPDLS